MRIVHSAKLALVSCAALALGLTGSVATYPAPAAAEVVQEDLPGQYHPARTRVFDTTIAANTTVEVPIAGVGELPAGNIDTIALNMSAKGSWFNKGSLVVYPSGSTEPSTSALNYNPNFFLPNMVTTKVGANGAIKIANKSTQNVRVHLDVLGFTLTAEDPLIGVGADYITVEPARLLDGQSIAPAGNFDLITRGQGGIPNEASVEAVALNVTALNAQGLGTLRVHPGGELLPTDSTIDYTSNRVLQNFVIAKLGDDGKINLHNASSAATQVWVDVVGYFAHSPTQTQSRTLQSVTPARVSSNVSIAANSEMALVLPGQGGLPALNVDSVGVNITATSSGTGTIQVYPDGGTNIGTQIVGYVPNSAISGFTLAKLGTGGKIKIRNSGSSAATISVDVMSFTQPKAALRASASTANPGDSITLTLTGAPSSVTSVVATSPAFAEPVTLTAGTDGVLTGTAAIPSSSMPGGRVITAEVEGAAISTGFNIGSPGAVGDPDQSFTVRSTDVSEEGSVVTRSHNAVRAPASRPDQTVLGSGWRPEFLGDLAGASLADHSAEGYVTISSTDGNVAYEEGANGVFATEAGGQLTVDSGTQITEKPTPDLTLIWSKLGDTWLITSANNVESGTTTVGYDPQGRVSKVISPVEGTTPSNCVAESTPGCSLITMVYADATTATSETLGDIAGQLKEIQFTPDSTATSETIQTYKYDAERRLRTSVNAETAATESYEYDADGFINKLKSDGDTWTFAYTDGKLTQQTRTAPLLRAAARCNNAADWMWGKAGCTVDRYGVKHYGRKYPFYTKTPTGFWVVGIKEDNCTSAPDKPRGFNFIPACQMHDYGYGLIATGYLPRSKKSAVDSVFHTTMRDKTCPAAKYASSRRLCRSQAWNYQAAVRVRGNPFRGDYW